MKTKTKDIVFFIIVVLIVVAATLLSMDKKKTQEAQTIVGVHIKGEVNAPGYYELSYGSRTKDAILYAGGETENADLTNMNLAQVLRDGQEIVVNAKAGEEDVDSNSSATSKINLNTADMLALCKLDGIGESTAIKIIEYRKVHGMFRTIDELKKVKGIGEAKFNNIKDYITV